MYDDLGYRWLVRRTVLAETNDYEHLRMGQYYKHKNKINQRSSRSLVMILHTCDYILFTFTRRCRFGFNYLCYIGLKYLNFSKNYSERYTLNLIVQSK